MFNIAIDGPSASGKSTIAKQLAKKLSLTHIDTGAMYRAVAYLCILNEIDLKDEISCKKIAEEMDFSFGPENRIIINGENKTEEIRSEEVSRAASIVSQHLGVREALVTMQQEMAKSKGYIMDGRDIGTIVLPDAEFKFFQTADVAVRAKRRYKELLKKGIYTDYNSVLEDLERRDYRDINRKESPLRKADDAIEIDSSNLSIEEIVDFLVNFIESSE